MNTKGIIKTIKPEQSNDKVLVALWNLKMSLERELNYCKQDMDEDEIQDYKEVIKILEKDIRRRKNDKRREAD